jgi:hypothetical protein
MVGFTMIPLRRVFSLKEGIQGKEYSAARGFTRERFVADQIARGRKQAVGERAALLRSGLVSPLAQRRDGGSRGVISSAVFLSGLFRQNGRRSKAFVEIQNAGVRDFPAEGLRLASHGHSLFEEN